MWPPHTQPWRHGGLDWGQGVTREPAKPFISVVLGQCESLSVPLKCEIRQMGSEPELQDDDWGVEPPRGPAVMRDE